MLFLCIPMSHQAFSLFDTERSGAIDARELKADSRGEFAAEHFLLHFAQWKAALRALGFEVKKEDVRETQRFLEDLRYEGHGPKRYGLHSGPMKLVDGHFFS